MLRDYKLLTVLGKGTYGKVFKSKCLKTGEEVALKEVSLMGMTEKQQKEALNESQLMSQVRHKYIIQYQKSFIQNKHLYIVMEYAAGGDLETFLKHRRRAGRALELDEIWEFLQQLCEGLEYLHEKRILHRDIKSKNIFLDVDGKVKIGDFGLGRTLGPETYFANTTVGTPLYFSPELCQEQNYNDKSDVWALGCVLYELATFSPPFIASNQLALARRIVNDEPQPIDKRYGAELHFLITKMLKKDMHERPRMSQILNYAPLKQRRGARRRRKESVSYEKLVTMYKSLQAKRVNDQTWIKRVLKRDQVFRVKVVAASDRIQQLRRDHHSISQSILDLQHEMTQEMTKMSQALEISMQINRSKEPDPEYPTPALLFTAHELRLCSAETAAELHPFHAVYAWRRAKWNTSYSLPNVDRGDKWNTLEWVKLLRPVSSCLLVCTVRHTPKGWNPPQVKAIRLKFEQDETIVDQMQELNSIPFREFHYSPKRQNIVLEISHLVTNCRDIAEIQWELDQPSHFDEITLLTYDRRFLEIAALSRREREQLNWLSFSA